MDPFPGEPPSSGGPIPPVDEASCALLGPTGLLVQAIMAVIVLGSLVVKRSRENPRRPWPVWLADVGKQIIGQGFLHFTNVVFSTLFSHASKGDACTAYFLSIFVDCTLGVLIIYSTLRIFSYVLIERMRLRGYRTGQYYEKHQHQSTVNESAGDHDIVYQAEQGVGRDSLEDGAKPVLTSRESQPLPEARFQFSWWGKQLMVYLVSLVVMKLAILGFFWIPAVLAMGDWMLSWLGEHTKVIFVLMIFPLAMNAFQFLLIDTILKSSTPFSESLTGEQPESTHSRRNSQDTNYRARDAEEGRAFLLHDTTRDEFDPGARDATPLPSYYEPSLQPGRMERLGSASSEASSQQHGDSKQGFSSFGSESDDYSSTPRPTSTVRVNNASPAGSVGNDGRNLSAIPLRPVIQGGANDSNGWDWLSDAGSVSQELEQNQDDTNMQARPALTTSTTETFIAKGVNVD